MLSAIIKAIKSTNSEPAAPPVTELEMTKLAALNLLRANVMMADDNLNITFLNESLWALMREAERELQKELPRFNTATLVGSNIDIFHKNPSHQRAMLSRNVLRTISRPQRKPGLAAGVGRRQWVVGHV